MLIFTSVITTKTNKMNNLRTATKKDFKVGTVLITSEGYKFSINEHYTSGIWNTRQGKAVMESEAKFYRVYAS